MTSKTDNLRNIIRDIIYGINCEGMSSTKPDAVRHLKSIGWKITRNTVLCPNCKIQQKEQHDER